ncbi:LysR family transcriptional regulator [Colwellia sp. KU-HH00111]|uniref:LysR family transcriptional regulator n=1 Tax=Colwellia sp. KU-HH00111 TaxID=3127652 RepID=UPI00310AE106
MTLDQIKTLCRIVECGTLQKAAQSLHKTQPALSMSIKKLENEYGFQILTRDNYRLTLTKAGQSFYHKAQELLQSASQLSSLGEHLGEGNEAKIRLGYDAICPLTHILPILKRCQTQFPFTEIELIGGSRFSALDLLKKEEIDIAISPWWPTLYALGGLESLPVTHFSVILVATPELFPAHKRISISDLKQEVHIDVEASDLSFDTHDLILLKGCRQWRTKDAYTLKNMLVEGLGWGYIPEFMVEEELQSGELVKLKLNEIEHEISGEIRLIKRQECTLGPVSTMIWNEFV